MDATPTNVIDKIAEEAGHQVLRLPPYHCQYNPIELIWAQVKTYIAKKNTFKMANLKVLVTEALSLITPQTWKKAVGHTEKIHDEDNQQDVAAENFVESFVINITECSDEEHDA
uniref:Tc1-like transposase DDE domain-containing protein n=1 Tax=Scylla olivacea TaxID=85551 RepID=A0A0P4VTN2_SCYOL